MQPIARTREVVGTVVCHRYGYCSPCPQGVTIIPLMDVGILCELWDPAWFFSFLEEPIANVANCADCGACEEKCPYNLPIREIIRKDVELYHRLAREKQVT